MNVSVLVWQWMQFKDYKRNKEGRTLDYKKLLKNKEVKAFLKKGNENLGVLGIQNMK